MKRFVTFVIALSGAMTTTSMAAPDAPAASGETFQTYVSCVVTK